MARKARDVDDDIEEEDVDSRVSHVVLGRPRYAPAEDGESNVYAGPPQFYPGSGFTPVAIAGKAPKKDYRLAQAAFQGLMESWTDTVEHLEAQVNERDEYIEQQRQEIVKLKKELKARKGASETVTSDRFKDMQKKLIKTNDVVQAYRRLHEKLLDVFGKSTDQKQKIEKMLKDAGISELPSDDTDDEFKGLSLPDESSV